MEISDCHITVRWIPSERVNSAEGVTYLYDITIPLYTLRSYIFHNVTIFHVMLLGIFRRYILSRLPLNVVYLKNVELSNEIPKTGGKFELIISPWLIMVVCQWFSHVPNSQAKIICKSHKEWPKKSLFTVTNILFYFLHAIWCPEHTISLNKITVPSFHHCHLGRSFLD